MKPPGAPSPAFSVPPPSDWIRKICCPVVSRIPASVHPNSISLLTHAIAWGTAILAGASVHLAQPGRSLALAVASLGMFLSMLGDCLDGMHARATSQCSQSGELMDHWLDTLIVPLVTVGMTLALEAPPWAIVSVNLLAIMVYHAQLVLHHETGNFIHPEPAEGIEGQIAAVIIYAGAALSLAFFSSQSMAFRAAVWVLAIIATVVEAGSTAFYYRQKGFRFAPHLLFAALGLGFGVLYWTGKIGTIAYVFSVLALSFRVSGTYVLSSVLNKPCNGRDLATLLWLAGVTLVALLAPPWADTSVLAGCIILATAGLRDLILALPGLK